MRWVTREKVKVDRVTCPWLIRRFIDPNAEFVFLPPDTDWSRVDGTVFDTPGAELGHHGEGVSFDAILDKYGLSEPALRLLAEIVRAADSHPSQPHPADAAGGVEAAEGIPLPCLGDVLRGGDQHVTRERRGQRPSYARVGDASE